MNRILLVVAWVCSGLVMVMIGLALSSRDQLLQLAHRMRERSEGAELADKLDTPRDVLDYIATHPEQVSIASWELGREGEGLFLHADRRQPIAAASELLVLARYAGAIAQGEHSANEAVPVAHWERHWLPGSDGGAHVAALHEARARGRVISPSGHAPDAASGPVVHVQDLARAMIRYGDHAASDWFIARYGRAQLRQQAKQLGFELDAALMPFSGLQLSWLGRAHTGPAPELLARYRALGASQYAQLVWDLATRLSEDAVFRGLERSRMERQESLLSLKEQAQLTAALTARGSARDYARLMQQVVGSQLPGSAHMRELLEWPLEGAATRAEFDVFATKRGGMPGVLTSATYARAKGAAGTKVLALFFHRLPLAVWLRMSQTFVQQRFEAELLQDETFFALARERLSQSVVQRTISELEPDDRHANAQ